MMIVVTCPNPPEIHEKEPWCIGCPSGGMIDFPCADWSERWGHSHEAANVANGARNTTGRATCDPSGSRDAQTERCPTSAARRNSEWV